MAKKPTAKSTPAVAPVQTPAPAAKSAVPPKRLIATARPPAGRASKTAPVAKDATPKAAPAPAPAVVPTPAAVVAPPKPSPAAKPARVAAKPANAAPAAAKTAVKPIKLTSSRKKAPAAPKTVTDEEIAVRAYLIAEHRHQHGIWGEPHLDWIEAERQLKAELSS
ncbi:MAG TPA: DUF2934 domain-containing protein [Chthoniobacteraceae bacterium]|jgi:hypothetical protein|nr:DUF2934 domain-containing protein [Chthoniobacteraceae bacterium]